LALGWTDDDVENEDEDDDDDDDEDEDIARMPITATLGIEREAIV
jgi:hypothetical protein